MDDNSGQTAGTNQNFDPQGKNTTGAGNDPLLNYKFGDISEKLSIQNVKIPENTLNFDRDHFLRLLAGSISLTKDEKKKIILAIPKLSQFQIDELIKILKEEKRKFRELDAKHLEQLKKLEEKHAKDWEDMEHEYLAESKASEDQNKADEIRKNLGL